MSLDRKKKIAELGEGMELQSLGWDETETNYEIKEPPSLRLTVSKECPVLQIRMGTDVGREYLCSSPSVLYFLGVEIWVI